jgi:hypothetical protein
MAVRPDVIVFAVGLLLFVAGIGGILALPSQGGIAQAFAVTWHEQSKDLPSLGSVTLAENGKGAISFKIGDGNLSRIVFHVACTDNSPLASQAAASVQAAIAGPGNLSASGSTTCGKTLDLPVLLEGNGTAQTASGTSADDATAQLEAQRVSTLGEGTWNATVTLSRSSPVPGGLPGPVQTGGASIVMSGTEYTSVPAVAALAR